MEEFALDMGQNANDAAAMGAIIKSDEEEYA